MAGHSRSGRAPWGPGSTSHRGRRGLAGRGGGNRISQVLACHTLEGLARWRVVRDAVRVEVTEQVVKGAVFEHQHDDIVEAIQNLAHISSWSHRCIPSVPGISAVAHPIRASLKRAAIVICSIV